ncbi:MAG: hypothetical protein RBR16_04385 [Syntrophus sp. (in: bacteria)]|nr:hypothetical protein [Syntrophus sp. (in: bacteria)]
MERYKQELLKKIGLTEEDLQKSSKLVNPSEEQIIDGLERLLEELIKEEEQEKDD